MTLQKGFLHRKLPFSEIPLTRKYIGPFMGVLVAITFYALLYYSRDIFRDLSARQPEFFWELTKEELNFYNFFYAAISSLLGQSVCFNIWFHRSRQMFSSPKLFGNRVLNDQNVLIWYFLAWFGKLAFLYWIFFGLTFWGGHYIFSFYPDYNYLFLQSWTNFRLLFVKQSPKWILTPALILGLFSFALSKVNFIDQEAFQQRKQEASIYNKYDFELPQSDYYERPYSYLSHELVLVLDSSNTESPNLVLFEGQEIPLSEITVAIRAERNQINEAERSLFHINLYVDQRVSIEFVEKVKAEIARADIHKIYYMVVPLNPEYDVRFYSNYGIVDRIHLSHYYPDSVKYDTIMALPDFYFEPPPTISPTKIRVNSSKLNQAELQEILKERIKEEPAKIIRYNYNPSDPFSKYLRVYSAAHLAVDSLRQELYMQMTDTMKDYNEYDLRYRIGNKIRFGFQAIPKQK